MFPNCDPPIVVHLLPILPSIILFFWTIQFCACHFVLFSTNFLGCFRLPIVDGVVMFWHYSDYYYYWVYLPFLKRQPRQLLLCSLLLLLLILGIIFGVILDTF